MCTTEGGCYFERQGKGDHEIWYSPIAKTRFKVVLKPDPEDGGFNVSCPALSGCHSQGETEEEAIENIKDAIIGCLEVLNQRAHVHDESEKVIEVAVG